MKLEIPILMYVKFTIILKKEINFKIRLNVPAGWKQLNDFNDKNYFLTP